LPLEANIIPLYNCVNSDGSSGLSTNELKDMSDEQRKSLQKDIDETNKSIRSGLNGTYLSKNGRHCERSAAHDVIRRRLEIAASLRSSQ